MSEGIRVRIGPSVDRAAFDAAFASISQSAKRAFDKIGAEAAKAGTVETAAARSTSLAVERELQKRTGLAQREAKKIATAEEAEAKRMLRTLENAERMKVQAAQRAARDRASAERQYYRDLEREQRKAEQDSRRYYQEIKRQAREAASEQRRSSAHPRVAVGLGQGVSLGLSGAAGGVAGIMRYGMGMAADFAHAYGVNTSVATAMEKNADLETLATQITNEAHEKGQTYANAGALTEQAFNIGSATGTGANKIMEGFQEFVGKTGDLTTAQDTMQEMAKIAKATGSSLKDVVGAAADVSNQFGDIPNKGQKVNEVMRILAGEAKLGAVPMRALASQASKVVATAQMMEGDVGKNMGLLGAVAQEARLRGGSASAQQAATSVTSLMNTFSKGARVNAFRAQHISLTGAGGKARNVEDVIVESLQKTQKGNDATASSVALGKLFADVRARSAVRGFETIFRSTYSSAGGNEQEKLAAATKAVREEFDRLQHAAMDQHEVDESFARAMKNGQSQAELWNNATQKAAKEMQTALLPAMVSLTPKVVAAAKEFSDFVDWLTGKKHDPDPGAVRDDMDAVHKALKAPGGKVDAALVSKGIQDAQKLGAQATALEDEARGLKEHRGANVAYHAADMAAKSHNWYDVSYLGTGFDFAKNLISGKAGAAADKEQSDAARQAKEASDQAMNAFKELTSATLKVHIVSSDVKSGDVNGAATPSTDSLSTHPSGH